MTPKKDIITFASVDRAVLDCCKAVKLCRKVLKSYPEGEPAELALANVDRSVLTLMLTVKAYNLQQRRNNNEAI